MNNDKCKMTNDKCSGFSLLELLAVVALISISVFMMAGVFTGRDNQERFDQTVKKMEEIKKAILGPPLSAFSEKIRSAGYVPDMGELPGLYDVLDTPDDPSDDQPKGLWAIDLNNDGDDNNDLVRRTIFIDDMSDRHYINYKGYADHKIAIISLGWRGPYIESPRDGVLRDGWGNPIVFEPDTPEEGDLTIKSRGADGNPGGSGYDEDVELTIKKNRYLAEVAGYVAPNTFYDHNNVKVELFYAPPDQPYNPEIHSVNGPQTKIKDLKSTIQGVREDGFFLFKDVPVGRECILKITEPVQLGDDTHSSLMFYRFYAMEPANWLGAIEKEMIYGLGQ